MSQASFSSFLVICFLLTITPGADTALVLKSAVGGGRKFFIATVAGISTGLFFHATMSSLGLSAVLASSAQLYSVIKFAGAAYLIFLGARGLFEAWSKSPHLARVAGETSRRRTYASEFRVGLVTNILNPKVAVFYLTFLPQFVDPRGSALAQSLGFALIHVSMSFVWLCLVGYFVGYFRVQLAKPKVLRGVESVTGLALIGFGLKLAVSAQK